MPIPRLKMVPAEAIVLDTEESQECHRILDWLASTVDHPAYPCRGCWRAPNQEHAPHCMAVRARRLIEKWANP